MGYNGRTVKHRICLLAYRISVEGSLLVRALCGQGWGPTQGSGSPGLPETWERQTSAQDVWVCVQRYDGGKGDREGPATQGGLGVWARVTQTVTQKFDSVPCPLAFQELLDAGADGSSVGALAPGSPALESGP